MIAQRTIRPIAICLIRRGDEVLVFEGRDETRRITFYRPLGGGIEFGERSEVALRRELFEEIGAQLADLRLLEVIENTFELEGVSAHEVVFVYEGRFADSSLYGRETFTVQEDPLTLRAGWRRLDTFDMGSAPLYPEGLLELLTGETGPIPEERAERLVGATAAVVRGQQILLVRRRDIGTWEMPGGVVDRGEAPWDTAVRECFEESGVEVEAGRLAGLYYRPAKDIIILVFRCHPVGGEPGPTEESVEAGWFEFAELPSPIVEVVRERIADIARSNDGGYGIQRGRGNSDLRDLR